MTRAASQLNNYDMEGGPGPMTAVPPLLRGTRPDGIR
jgi:hypothetical protein